MRIISKKILKKILQKSTHIRITTNNSTGCFIKSRLSCAENERLEKKIDSRMNSKNTGATIFTREMMSSEKIDAELLKSKEK